MLEVRQLTRRYGDYLAVDKVSFQMGKGEIVGLLGHNGAGKTTIMKMISGYLEPNAGEIHFGGYDLITQTKQAQQLLGYLPENLPLYPEMTVADYLDYAADLKGLKSQKKINEVRRVIAATEIQAKAIAPIGTLSRGFKQRVGVAQALLGSPKLLILDEPTNGLDPTQTEHMRTLIQRLAQEATVILSTHVMQEVEALCDRVLIIRNGQLVVDEGLTSLRHAQQIRISTSFTQEQLQSSLQSFTDVVDIELVNQSLSQAPDLAIDTEIDALKQAPVCVYRLHLGGNKAIEEVSASLAKTLIQAGAYLYQLTPETHDLETLFRTVNQGTYSSTHNCAVPSATAKEVTHAA